MSDLKKIEKLLRPRSIAIVGATEDPAKMGGALIPSLKSWNYPGQIYPVNPNRKEVSGYTCYPSVDAIPGEVDHCIVVVGKDFVNKVIQDCRKKGVPAASIFASGYAEADSDGGKAQDELKRVAGDMVFVGPNCQGFTNLVDRVNATSAPIMRRYSTLGDVALLTQSGGLGLASVASLAPPAGVTFSYIVNTGNSIGVSFDDLVCFLFDDAHTKVIMVAAESENVVGEVLAAVRRRGLVKPIVMLKLGRGETGVRMALSHTGSLAGDYRLVRDCAEQLGVTCVDDLDEAIGAAALLRKGITARNAAGVATVCVSGGNIALFADLFDGQKIKFAELAPETEAKLREVLPSYISVHNPIDITRLGAEKPELHSKVLELLAQDKGVLTVVPIMTSSLNRAALAQQFANARKLSRAEMVVLCSGGFPEEKAVAILDEAGIPVMNSGGTFARCLDRLRRSELLPVSARRTPPAVPPAKSGALTEGESMAFLAAGGVPTPRARVCGRAELEQTIAAVGYPVVIKTNSADTHISDAGGVIVGIRDKTDLERAADRIKALPGDDLLVSQFLPGIELIVSTFDHPVFGRILMIGSGGQFAELQSDVRFLALPAGRSHLERALRSTLAGQALDRRFRGVTGFDPAIDFLERFSDLAHATAGEVFQIEMNPVTVGAHGAAAVDAAITVK